MSQQIPTAVLRHARQAAGLSQSALGPLLSVTASVVSRMESSEQTEREVAWRYLSAVGSDEAAKIREFYERDWARTERPSFLHPDREILWQAETALQQLAEFESSKVFHPLLARPVTLLRSRLLATAQYLLRTDHEVAWVGKIGVGKTTALSFATGLTLEAGGVKRSIFPTGSGRTTLCEVVVKVAPTYGLVVDSFGVDEVRAIVEDMITGIVKAESGVSAEMDRALRAMSDLNRESTVEAGKKRFSDPIRAMLDRGDTLDEVVNRIMARLSLDSRTGTKILLSEEKENGLEWLAANVTKVNFGRHPEFGIPSRITVLLPSKVLASSQYDLSVLDTKGIDGNTQRPDLRALLDDPRTLTVLCSGFNDAPGEVALSMLREIVETRSDAAERGRVCVLGLPRGDEALAVNGDSNETAITLEDGYLMREEQARHEIHKAGGVSVPIYFYNALLERPEAVWSLLKDQVSQLRSHHERRVLQLAASVRALAADSNAIASIEARHQVYAAINRYVERHGELPMQSRPAHQNLVEQMRITNASSLAASVSRRGVWTNFSVHHLIGVGVRSDAAARTGGLFAALDELLVDLQGQSPHLEDVVQSIDSLRDEAREWEQEFLGQALAIGRVAFRPVMDGANDLWSQCNSRWGGGGGYRDDVSSIIQTWFETLPELDAARRTVEHGLEQAWRELVLDRLLVATKVEELLEQESLS